MEVKKNKKRYYHAFFIILFVFMSSSYVNKANAQGIEISGKVIDRSGMPLPGTSIVIKGNTVIGVHTDFDGNYSIEIPNSKSILIFRFLGFVTQEIQVNNQRVINVVLQEDSESLDEVMVLKRKAMLQVP
jgi:TonB-dependent starch-binding outer membrane protein SusC